MHGRALALPAAVVAVLAIVSPASGSLDEGEELLHENRFAESSRAFQTVVDDRSAEAAQRAVALRGLALAHIAREEGVASIDDFAEAIAVDPAHDGNVGLVKIIERELLVSGVPEGWDEALSRIVEASEPYPVLRDYVIDLEIATARYRQDFEGAARGFAAYGPVNEFMIAGPFPNTADSGIYERYPPEERIDLDADYSDHLGRRFGWERWEGSDTSGFDLDLILGDEPSAVAYALTHVRVDEATSATVHLYGRGAFRLWVNGAPALRERTTRLSGPSLYEARVDLAEGWNRVLLKAGAELEPLNFLLRFRDSDDRTLYPDVDPDPSVYDGESAPAAPVPEDEMPSYTFDSLPDGSWLRAWRASLDGAKLPDWYSYVNFMMGHGYEFESERAIAECERLFPGSAVIAAMKAELLSAQGREGEAALIRRELAEESPEYTPAATFVVGEALEQGDIDGAWKKASEALSRNPNNLILKVMHGALRAARGSVSQGVTEMAAAFEEAPGNQVVRTIYLMLLRMLRTESEYEAALEEALEARPDDPSLARQAASTAFEMKRYDEAIGHLRHARRLGERPDVIGLSVGRVLEEAGRLEEALEAYEEGLRAAPRSVPLHQAAAQLLQRLGDDAGALEHYRTVAARRPLAFASKELVRRLEGRPPLEDYLPQENLESLLESDLSWVEDEPNAVRLLESQHVIVHPDGSHSVRRHTVTKILSEAGVDAYGGAATPYFFDAGDGMVEIARTLKSDGREIEADRGMGEVTFADVETGDVLELRYKSLYGPTVGLPGHFWHRHFFEDEIPTALSRMALLTPTDMDYSWEVHGGGPEPSRDDRDGWRLTVWELTEVPPAVVESRMPPWTERGIWLDLSTIPEWAEISRWYQSISRGRLHGGRRARELADTLSSVSEDDRERISSVTAHVRENIKYEGSGFIESGLVPRSLEEVLRTKLGDCKDQSVLLVYLLREMGIDANIALVNDRSINTVEHLPSPGFTHAIVRTVTDEGSVFWIDPTEQELSFPNVPVELEGALALLVDVESPQFTLIEPDAPDANGSDSRLSASVDESGDLAVEGACTYRGEDAAGFRYIALYYPEMLDEVKRDVIAAEHPAAVVDSAELTGAEDTSEDMGLTFSFRRTGAVSRAGDLMIVGVPWTVGTVPYDLVSLEERVHPLILDSWRGSYVETVELTVPEGYTLDSELPDISSECAAGRFSLKGEFSDDGAVVLTKRLDIDVFRVEPEDYAQFRAMLETGWRAEEQQLVYRSGSPAGD